MQPQYQPAGYVSRSYSGTSWDVYVGSTRIGAVKRSYGGRWDVYEGYSKVGYCTGTGGAVGGAAFLLLMLGG